jgi:creatinine amidohydrolase
MSTVGSDGPATIPVPPPAEPPIALAELTTEELASFLERAAGRAIALVPIGSTEPHGPHLPLSTDALLSIEVCRRAVGALRASGRAAIVAPSIPYGVTRYAAGFRGAIGVSEETLTRVLGDVARALLDDGFAHVAFVNNHLEPEHVEAVARTVTAIAGERGPEAVSFPNQLTRRWGRTLTDEFKRGDCHAGRYETALVLAAQPELVRGEIARDLPTLDVSLSKAIAARAPGDPPVTFGRLGMKRAYTGAPSEATRDEGDGVYARLVEMVVTEIGEHVDERGDTSQGSIPEELSGRTR